MKKTTITLCALLLSFLFVWQVGAGLDRPAVDWWTTAGSGNTASGGDFAVESLVGQTIVGQSDEEAASGYQVDSGFLEGESGVPTVVGLMLGSAETIPTTLWLLLAILAFITLYVSRRQTQTG